MESNNRQHPNAPDPKGAEQERQPANGGIKINAPRVIPTAEINSIFQAAKRWLHEGDQSGIVRDLFNVAHTALDRGRKSEQLGNINMIANMHGDEGLNIIQAVARAYKKRDELQVWKNTQFAVTMATHKAIEQFEAAFGVKPRIGQGTAERINNLQQLAAQLESERDFANEALNRGEGFENRSASYVAMFLGEQAHFESFPLPLHVRARKYLSDLRKRLAQVQALQYQVETITNLRDSVANNFDDLHAAAIEALAGAWTRAGYGLTAHLQAWQSLDAEYMAQVRKREAQAGAGQAAEGKPEPMAQNAAAMPPAGEKWRFNRNAEAFEPRIEPAPSAGGFGGEHQFDTAPLTPTGEREIANLRRVGIQLIMELHAAQNPMEYGISREDAMQRLDELLYGRPHFGKPAIEPLINMQDRMNETMNAANRPFIGQAEAGCSKECEGKGRCVNGWADGSCGARPQGTKFPKPAQVDNAPRGSHYRAKHEQDARREPPPIGTPIMDYGQAKRIAEHYRQKQSEVCHYETTHTLGGGAINRIINLQKVSPTCPHVLRDGKVIDERGDFNNVSFVGASPETFDDMVRFQGSIVREAKRRGLPDANAQVAFGALLAAFDSEFASVQRYRAGMERIKRTIADYAPGIQGGTTPDRVSRFAEEMDLIQKERDGWLREIRNAINGFRKYEPAGDHVDGIPFDSDASLPRRLRYILSEMDQSLMAAEEAAREQEQRSNAPVFALNKIRNLIEPLLIAPVNMPHDLTYGECVFRLVEGIVKAYKSTLDKPAEGSHACYHVQAICRATNTQTFGSAMAEIGRLQRLEERAVNQLRIILNKTERAYPNAQVLNMIAILGEEVANWKRRAQDGADAMNKRGEYQREVELIWNIMRDFEPAGFRNIAEESLSTRVRRLLQTLSEGNEWKRAVEEVRRALRDYFGSDEPSCALAIQRYAEELKTALGELQAAKSLLWSITLPPEWMHDIRQAKTLADAIRVLDAAHAAEIVELSENQPAQNEDWREALRIMRRVDGVPQERSLTETADVVSALAAERLRTPGGAIRLNIKLFAEFAAQALLQRWPFIAGGRHQTDTLAHLMADKIADAIREWFEGNLQILKPGIGNLTLEDCRGIARDLKGQFVVLRSASVMDAGNGVPDEELAHLLFEMLNPTRKQEAAEENETCGICGMDDPCPNNHE